MHFVDQFIRNFYLFSNSSPSNTKPLNPSTDDSRGDSIEEQSGDKAIVKTPDHKTNDITTRIFKSPLFWTASRLTTITIITAVVISRSSSPLPMATTGLVMGAINFSPAITDTRKLVLEASFIWTVFAHNCLNRPWYHTILKDHLTLGAIPLINYNHLRELKAKGITAVVTALEPHEWNQDNFFGIPVKPEDWIEAGIEHFILETPDFTPLSQENIQKGVEFLKKIIQEKKGHVYVHCKAGAGRSSTIVICYLIKYGEVHNLKKFNADEAIAYATTLRPAVNINRWQKEAIKTFYERQ